MAEKQSIKKVSKEQMAKGIYEATFTNGKVVSYDFGAELPVYADLNDVQKGFYAYGVKQKLDDSMAGAADVDEAIEELESTVEALKAGKWTVRVGGEGGGEAGGLLARAMAEARGISLAEAKTKLSEAIKRNQEKNPEASERQLGAAIRAHMLTNDAKIAEAYNRLQAARNAKAKSKLNIVVED